MKRNIHTFCLARGGFTLVELVISSSVAVVVLAVSLAVFVTCYKSWHGIELRMDADRDVNMAMSHMVYGMGNLYGLRAAAASTVTLTSSGGGWTLAYQTGGAAPQTNSFTYSAASSNLVFNPGSQIAGKHLSYALALVGTRSVVVTLRVDRVDGTLNVRRELGTAVIWRN